MTKVLRTLIMPVNTSDFATDEEPLTFWKQILPEGTIVYDGQEHHFDAEYQQDCIDAFKNHKGRQIAFQLATPLNGHGRDFDPERQRAVVDDMATYDELPDSVKAQVDGKRGLYSKIRFFSKKAARVVRNMPDLGVSARVRENAPDAKGNIIKRSVIHVLGTIDPYISNMAAWQPAVDLSSGETGAVIDLSQAQFKGEAAMAKVKGGTATVDAPDIATLTQADIAKLTDEELAAFLEKYNDIDDELDDDDADDADIDAGDGADDGADDDDDDDTKAGDTNLSRSAQRQIDMANAAARTANAAARSALTRTAAAEWKAERQDWERKGVSPVLLDLATPILNRPEEFVVDLSNEGGKEKSLNVAEIMRAVLEHCEGEIDLSHEAGHGDDGMSADRDNTQDDVLLDMWEKQHPIPGFRG